MKKDTSTAPATTTPTLAETFRKARSRAVPLIAIETADPAETVKICMDALNGKAAKTAALRWDICNGLASLNEQGRVWSEENSFDAMTTANPVEALQKLAATTPQLGLVFFSNAHRFTTNEAVCQGIWNLRDKYAGLGATLVLMAPSLILPPEIARDVVIIEEPLPTRAELTATLDSILDDTTASNPDFTPPPADDKPGHVDTLTGLSTFEAKQAVALSLTKTGLDGRQLWSRKVKQIEQCKGLTVYRGNERFADIGGLANAKRITGATIAGKLDVTCIVFIDELDKVFAAANSDTSGTTQDQNKAMLSYMQDNKRPGILFLGPPGTGKTALTKAAGNEHNKPVIFFDVSACKGSLVGQSEQAIRDALKIIHAVSDGRALFIGACNRSDNLPPELRRRFNFASIFFDLPDADERTAALRVWTAKHKLTADQCNWTPPEGWTGAEIENACLKSWAMDCTLDDAAKTIVPIALSARDSVDSLRKASSGKYISASAPGIYTFNQNSASTAPSARNIKL